MPETPPNSEAQTYVLGWCREAVQEGESFLRQQSGFSQIGTLIDIIMGESRDMTPSSLSNVRDNRIGKIALDLASGLTDVRPFWDYRTFNKRFENQAEMLDKLSQSWWYNRFIDLKFMNCVQYTLAAGSGYEHIVYNEHIGDLDVIPEDPRDVLPIRPSSYITLQDAFGVIVRRERTVNYVRALYPSKAHLITADREGSLAAMDKQTRAGNLMASVSPFMANLWEQVRGRSAAHLNVPVLDLYTMYVTDPRRNTRDDLGSEYTGQPIQMGEPGTNWAYSVQVGEPLYPRKRCIVFTSKTVLRDGPSIYWHGLFPICKLTLDPWPWSWLGKSPLKDALPLQAELDKLMRAKSNHNAKVAQPDLLADKNAISQAAMNKIDTRKAGLKLRFNPVAGKGAELRYPDQLDPSIVESIRDLRDEMDYLSGARDLTQLMRLNQIPSADTVEKMMEAMSPAIRMRSRVMEVFIREKAMMVAANFMQFYTLPQRLAVLGTEGMTFEDFDYDPGTMIPDFITPEDEAKGIVRPRAERAAVFIKNFSFHAAPGSLLSASEVTSKLLYIQLFRAGVLDIWSLFEKLGIPNAGVAPAGSIPERLAAMQQMGLVPAVSATGRKASAETMPRVSSKGITESK